MRSIQAIIWKEWRECRRFLIYWGACVLLARVLLPQLPKLMTIHPDDFSTWIAFLRVFVFPGVALILAIFPFGVEIKSGSISFLLSRPTSTAKIFWTKYLFSASAFITMALVSVLAFRFDEGSVRDRIIPNLEANPLYWAMMLFMFTLIFVGSMHKKTLRRGMFFVPVQFLVFCMFSITLLSICIYYEFAIFPAALITVVLSCITILAVGFLCWQRKISKDASPFVMTMTGYLLLWLAVALFHFGLILYSEHRLKAAVAKAEKAGLQMAMPAPHAPDGDGKTTETDLLCQDASELVTRIFQGNNNAFYYSRSSEPNDAERDFLLNHPDCRELRRVIQKIIAPPGGKINKVTFDEYGYYSDANRLRTLSAFLHSCASALAHKDDYEGCAAIASEIISLAEMIPPSDVHELQEIMYIKEHYLAVVLLLPGENRWESEFKDALALCSPMRNDVVKCRLSDTLRYGYFEAKQAAKGPLAKDSPLVSRLFVNHLVFRYLRRPVLCRAMTIDINRTVEKLHLFQRSDPREIARAIDERDLDPEEKLWGPSLSFSYSSFGSCLRQQASIDLPYQALALKLYRAEHGAYPESLDLLVPGIIPELPVDYYAGMAYAYLREGDGCLLYSVGGNRKDDEGESIGKADDIAWTTAH